MQFWKSDWLLSLIVTAVVFLGANSTLIQGLERKAYDIGVQVSSRMPSSDIAVIAIDDQSLGNLGRWPWPRDIHAKMIDLLASAKPKVIGTTIAYIEPERDPGYAYISKLLEIYETDKAAAAKSPGKAPVAPALERIGSVLVDAEQTLNTDRKLADSVERAGNVVVSMFVQPGTAVGRPDKPLPEYVMKNAVFATAGTGYAMPAAKLQVPIEAIGTRAAGIGHAAYGLDVDGGVRSDLLVVSYYGELFPSMSLLIAAKSLNLGPGDIRMRIGEGVYLGNLRVATDVSSQMNMFFYKDRDGRPAFPVDSFYDVLTGKIPPAKYAGKIVLIGPTALGVVQTHLTPISPAMPGVLSIAHTVSSILHEHFFVAPVWASWARIGAFVVVGLYLTLLLPRLNAAVGALATAGLIVVLFGVHFGLMLTRSFWVQLMGAATLALFGHLLLTTKHYLMTERGKLLSDLESAESNRMLGLAFQGQGQLDMAWDKFRKCPVDNQLLENLYNLALDFERKRQFNKSESVFTYMAEHDPNFRDLAQRLRRAKQLSEAVVLGGAHGASAGGTLILDGRSVEKPMLGRYQVEKELGKGAMGVVYMGRDPKINRIVAIKTMALSDEFEGAELDEVKQRFFREAETAGRLNHPNIVTMYDAGEEHDLAFIAMEFLKGRDLVPYTSAERLLPLPQALSIIARVADALDYAHRNNVVHRDIKPANIMYEPEADQVKVTDFGIARITDSSRTKTGTVMGTPSYMSPEQLMGKKIDGRSDLFSLGVTLYQLACGELPFVGEGMAQLMFKIATGPTPDIRQVNADAPAELAAIIERVLKKDPAERYQTGEELAKDLRSCPVA